MLQGLLLLRCVLRWLNVVDQGIGCESSSGMHNLCTSAESIDNSPTTARLQIVANATYHHRRCFASLTVSWTEPTTSLNPNPCSISFMVCEMLVILAKGTLQVESCSDMMRDNRDDYLTLCLLFCQHMVCAFSLIQS